MVLRRRKSGVVVQLIRTVMLLDMSAFIGAKIAEPRQSEEEYLHRV